MRSQSPACQLVKKKKSETLLEESSLNSIPFFSTLKFGCRQSIVPRAPSGPPDHAA